MSEDSQGETAIDGAMDVTRTNPLVSGPAVDDQLGTLFPHQGPVIVLDIDSHPSNYSHCELDLTNLDLPPVAGVEVEFQ